MVNPLRNYRILVVDADMELAHVLKTMLGEMGFTNVNLTRSGKEAINQLRTSPFDFVITEWNTQHMDGLSLLKYLRRDPASPNPTIPIIMLTGRAEQVDVFLTRDFGINEYVIKPFTARTIFNRLERLIETPRPFVISENFVGPDRRIRGKPPEGITDRRTVRPPKIQPKDISINDLLAGKTPQIWLPDFSLKLKLGKDVKLQDFITQDVLNHSQAAIDSITHDSLQWIRDNLRELKGLHESMVGLACPPDISEHIREIALTINSRAGTFGYSRAAEIAYALYLFARNTLDPKNSGHHIILQKHVEVLHVILGNQMRGNAGAVGAQIASELKALIAKYA